MFCLVVDRARPKQRRAIRRTITQKDSYINRSSQLNQGQEHPPPDHLSTWPLYVEVYRRGIRCSVKCTAASAIEIASSPERVEDDAVKKKKNNDDDVRILMKYCLFLPSRFMSTRCLFRTTAGYMAVPFGQRLGRLSLH